MRGSVSLLLLLPFFSCDPLGKSFETGAPFSESDTIAPQTEVVDEAEETGTETGEGSDTSSQSSGELPAEQCDDAYLLELTWGTVPIARIWRYDLETLTLSEVGQLDCPFTTEGDYLVAMTADRKGQLYSLARSGEVYRTVPSLADCSATSFSGVSGGFMPGSLAFMRSGQDSSDIMYFSVNEQPWTESSRGGLAIYSAGSAQYLGDFGVVGYDAYIDLAGTGDGQMYGLRPRGGECSLVAIDSETGAITQDWELEVPAPQGWSLVHLQGTFWLFTSADAQTTRVSHFDPGSGDLEFMDTIPFQVVGAALPTCAPDNSGS
jgi:hypothetical protein